MNGSLEDRLGDLLASRSHVRDEDLEPLRAYIRALPPRRAPSRSGTWATIAAVVAVTVIGIGALALANGLGSSGAWVPPSSAPVEGDPARFADDSRFLTCVAAAQFAHGSGQYATHAFEIDRARDYRRHLPAMLRSPELEVDDPALIVVFEVFDASPLPTPLPGEPTAEPTEAQHDVCVVVGADSGERNYYPDVDVTGLTVTLPGDLSGPPSGSASPAPGLPSALDLEAWFDGGCASEGGCIVVVSIVGPGGPWDATLVPDANGVYRGSGRLPADLPVGSYALTVRAGEGSDVIVPGQTPAVSLIVECEANLLVTGFGRPLVVRPIIGRYACGIQVSEARESPSPSAVAETPPWALDLRSQLECSGPPREAGYERGDGPSRGRTGTASVGPWLEATQDVDLPIVGWTIEPSTRWEFGESHYTRHVYRAGGRIRALILMEGTSRQAAPGDWAVTAWRSCSPDEFDPSDGRTTDDAPMYDPAGARSTAAVLIAGPAHCDWQSMVWLQYADRTYIRDPFGLAAEVANGPYTVLAELPPGSTPTGLESVRWELFEAADPDRVIMRTPAGEVEVWPAVPELFGCV